MSEKIKILLYYKYVPIAHPKKLRNEQFNVCTRLGIKGRIIIATEGINGTIAGDSQAIDTYIEQTKSLPEFTDIEWKISFSEEQVFPKLKVRVRDEIVTLGIKKTGVDVSLSNKAHYIEPKELASLYENNQDFVILDARNAYEAKIGKFKDAIIPPIRNFREFPQFVNSKLSKYKNKPVITYCTGGVRCEKASAYLREQGFTNVKQLHGGVHVYAQEAQGKYFEGELFVFDKRLQTQINTVNPTIIAQCEHCNTPITRLIDCCDASCDSLLNCCASCEEMNGGGCLQHKNSNCN